VSTEAAAKGQDAETVVREIVSLLDGMTYPLVVVNGAYDFTILRQEMLRLKIGRLEDVKLPPIIDTLVCDRKLDVWRKGRRSLTAVAASYGICIRGAHTAYGDIVCSLKLARAMARKYPAFASCDLDKLQKMQAVAHEEWCENFEAFRRIDDSDFMVSHGWPYQVYDSEQLIGDLI
jgi:DNA polymerase-3 subunit epsilon